MTSTRTGSYRVSALTARFATGAGLVGDHLLEDAPIGPAPQTFESGGFDLPDALRANPEHLADLRQRVRARARDAEP